VALCDLMLRLGPDAPTLCAGWATADLATHLLVRERKPMAGPGLVMGGAAARLTERIMARTKAAHSYDDIVARVRAGPPLWTAPFDGLINLNEYFVHHEDVRRGAGDTTPRAEEDRREVEDALWRSLHKAAGFMTRAVRGTGLDLVAPGRDTIAARRGTSKARLIGTPGEIALFLSGRGAAAHVDIDGDPDAVSALRGARFGL
jgi:uncharacterized protein (TIGR03085 family)